MARRLADPREHLQRAALKLVAERGLDSTTVAEIAAEAGLSERTFFRYFVDKREAIFSGSEDLEHAIVSALADARDGDPIALVAHALDQAASFFPDERRALSRRRRRVIESDSALRERELLKLASLSSAIAQSLRQRGVDADTAAIAGETGVAIFRVAHTIWIVDGEQRSKADIQRALWTDLYAMNPKGNGR